MKLCNDDCASLCVCVSTLARVQHFLFSFLGTGDGVRMMKSDGQGGVHDTIEIMRIVFLGVLLYHIVGKPGGVWVSRDSQVFLLVYFLSPGAV
jgi:hypothetical protein